MAKGALYLALLAGTLGFILAFAMPAFFKVPLFWYYPLAHLWTFELTPQGLAMDWYGRTLLAAVVGGLSFILSYLVARRFSPGEKALTMWLIWAVTAWFFATGLYVYQLVQRTPTPEPLPSGYQPR